MSTIIDWSKENRVASVALCLCAAFALFVVTHWFRSNAIEYVNSPSLDTYEFTLDRAIEKNGDDLQNWYRINIIIQVVLIITGLLATISAASTNKENTEWIRKYTVILTAITSTLAVILTNFHIRENIETFIRANADLDQIEQEYLRDRAASPIEAVLREREAKLEAAKAAGKAPSALDKINPPEVRAIWAKYEQRYLSVEAARLHAWASVGQQSLPSYSPPPEQTPETHVPKSPESTPK